MDLEKVVGGGAEAFWRRADRGMQLDLDPTIDVSEPQKDGDENAARGVRARAAPHPD
jgi:hypothetical protein